MRRRVERVPAPLRPAVAGFCEKMLHARERARRAGTRARSDHTVETALTIVGDLAQFLVDERGKHGWELVDVGDIEAFLASMPASRKRRLVVLRQFFRFARAHRLILVDPARDLSASEPSAFRGSTLTLAEQRSLFRRWVTIPAPIPTLATRCIRMRRWSGCSRCCMARPARKCA